MSLKKKISALALTSIVGISGLIGYNSMNPSKPNYTDDSKTNVKFQMEHIENISKEPHSVLNPEAKSRVKDYIVSKLEKLGVKTKTYKHNDIYEERIGGKVNIENIYGEIKGETDSYIMLVTHYDSADAEKGVPSKEDGPLGSADAGYGISTILETLRVIKENNVTLKNGIKVLFTDGEEYGLLGSKEAVKHKEIFKGVNFLVNLEARGTSGPAIMFETSPNNKPVLDLYEASNDPFSYSITPDIYRVLPNYTDFTEFLNIGLTGINISVLDGLKNYHTQNDSPENVSEKSMQHYGEQVLPIVKEFVSNEKYSNPDNLKGKEDSIFFSLGSAFIRYSKAVNIGLIAIILIGIIFIIKKFELKAPKKILNYLVMNTLFTAISMGVGYGISRVLAIINGKEFKLTYLPSLKFEGFIFIAVMISLFVGYFLTIKKFTSNFEYKNEFTVSSLISLLILSLIFTVALPGASYLAVFPAILLVVSIFIKLVLSNIKNISYIMLLPIALTVMLYVPTIYLFNCALTMGALCVNIFFAMIAYTAIMISFINMKELF